MVERCIKADSINEAVDILYALGGEHLLTKDTVGVYDIHSAIKKRVAELKAMCITCPYKESKCG